MTPPFCSSESASPTRSREVWYYEHPLPEGRKQYTKTQPLQYEEFEPCLAWWHNRAEGERAWRMPVERIVETGYNLDVKYPNARQDLGHLPPEQLLEGILVKERRIVEILAEIKTTLEVRE